MSTNSKIDKFRENSKKFAEDFEKKQEAQSQGTDPTLSDITANFNKNRNEIVIGERKFIIKKFGIRDTMTMIPILGNALAVPMSAIAGSGGDEEAMNGITEGLLLLFNNMENGKFFEIVDLLLSNTTLDGNEVDLEENFEDISEVFKICAKILEVNFSPFMKSLDLSRMTGWLNNIQQLR